MCWRKYGEEGDEDLHEAWVRRVDRRQVLRCTRAEGWRAEGSTMAELVSQQQIPQSEGGIHGRASGVCHVRRAGDRPGS